MSYDEVTASARVPHSLTMENREKLSLTGVKEVLGFDEELVCVRTPLGELSVHGERLHVEKIDPESGAVCLSGSISELVYRDPVIGRGTLSRIFGQGKA